MSLCKCGVSAPAAQLNTSLPLDRAKFLQVDTLLLLLPSINANDHLICSISIQHRVWHTPQMLPANHVQVLQYPALISSAEQIHAWPPGLVWLCIVQTFGWTREFTTFVKWNPLINRDWNADAYHSSLLISQECLLLQTSRWALHTNTQEGPTSGEFSAWKNSLAPSFCVVWTDPTFSLTVSPSSQF